MQLLFLIRDSTEYTSKNNIENSVRGMQAIRLSAAAVDLTHSRRKSPVHY